MFTVLGEAQSVFTVSAAAHALSPEDNVVLESMVRRIREADRSLAQTARDRTPESGEALPPAQPEGESQ